MYKYLNEMAEMFKGTENEYFHLSYKESTQPTLILIQRKGRNKKKDGL